MCDWDPEDFREYLAYVEAAVTPVEGSELAAPTVNVGPEPVEA